VRTKASLRRGGELGHAHELLGQQHRNRQHHHNVRGHRNQLGKFYSHAPLLGIAAGTRVNVGAELTGVVDRDRASGGATNRRPIARSVSA